MPFAELGLSERLLQAVQDAGYSEPTPIQQRAIPYVLQGRDFLGCAQTGTGKTASFTLPMIDILSLGRARARMPRSLILEPTRELAAQVAENFELYRKYHKLNMALLIGGVSFEDQRAVIDRGADVLIATPGRLLDHFERGGLLLRGVEILVVDEADRMLDMGFIPDVERIIQLTNPKRQTLLFSATMPKEIRRLADNFLSDPVEIAVAPPASPAETVDQRLTTVDERGKRGALRTLLREQPVGNALVFCNRKRDVDVVHKSLVKHGFDAAALHGDMNQAQRMETLDRFKKDEVKILVCSDVAARGLDIQGLSHVFLFDVPIHAEDYVHRIGRTGRAGMPGRAFTLATPADGKFVAAIEQLIGKPIPRFEIEGMESPELDEDGGRRPRRRGRERDKAAGGGRGKAGGGRGERRQRKSADESAAEAPKEAAAKRPEKTSEQSRGKKTEERGGRRRQRRREPEEAVVGLGDHVPSFLLRPVNRPRSGDE